MPLDHETTLKHLFEARSWLIVRDASAAEDLFQNVALKLVTKNVSFEHDGWCEIAIPLSDFQPLSKQHAPSTGCIINSVLISPFKQDAHLTLS